MLLPHGWPDSSTSPESTCRLHTLSLNGLLSPVVEPVAGGVRFQAVVSSQTLGGQLAGDTDGQKDLCSISDMGTLSPTVVMRTQILTPPGEATSKVLGLSEPQCLLL